MIPVSEAKKILTEAIHPINPVRLSLDQCAGLTLAEDVYAAMDIPAYQQSSMDGYAFSFEGWKENKSLTIAGESAAGDDNTVVINKLQAIRIFTGAAIPYGADTVVMQEKVKVRSGNLVIEDEKLEQGNNVRPIGSEIKAGTLALQKGSFLSPGAIGFLAGIGVSNLLVYRKPSVGIIITGNELQQQGEELSYGKVYESNSFALKAALKTLYIDPPLVYFAKDDLAGLTGLLKKLLKEHDIVLLTGGVSVGDYDFVAEAATICGVTTLFHRIKQRPGKPLFAGKKDNKFIFGLPGNPSSVLTCFYEYVLPVLMRSANKDSPVQIKNVPLTEALSKPGSITQFFKGYFDGEKVSRLDAQESYRMSSFARANCLIQIEEEVTICEKGSLVEIHLFPF